MSSRCRNVRRRKVTGRGEVRLPQGRGGWLITRAVVDNDDVDNLHVNLYFSIQSVVISHKAFMKINYQCI